MRRKSSSATFRDDNKKALYEKGFSLAEKGKELDKNGEWEEAGKLFIEAAGIFLSLSKQEKDISKKALLGTEIKALLERAEAIKTKSIPSRQQPQHKRSPTPDDILDDSFFDEEEKDITYNEKKGTEGPKEKAVKQNTSSEEKKADLSDDDIRLLIEQADFNYSQALAHRESAPPYALSLFEQAASQYLTILETKKNLQELFNREADKMEETVRYIIKETASIRKIIATSKSEVKEEEHGKLTAKEKAILTRTSYINGKKYYPWVDADYRENFQSQSLFVDSLLELSETQKKHFGGWKRPREIMKNPRMIYLISPYSIKQTIITDCSFVASLSVAAYYERRFRKRLITNIIFPQNGSGEPIYNPNGKYLIKLNLNGVPRRVLIDDRLPVDKNNQLMCSFSNCPGELWVSLVEKAFLKVMGGYQFPGSNSGIDLHILTGWIPERIQIGGDSFRNDAKQKQRLWERIYGGHKYGDCLITVATGSLSKLESEQSGLVERHAYAVLRIEEVDGLKMLQVKNPWATNSWRGKFSPEDDINWTPSLRKQLDYEKSEVLIDNGIFWIDYDSLIKWYNTCYMNWNVDLFQYKCRIHDTWPMTQGPKNDTYNFQYNPQYQITVTVPEGKMETIWFLLSRHVLEKEKDDDEDSREIGDTKKAQIVVPYIGMYIYELPTELEEEKTISGTSTSSRYRPIAGDRILDTYGLKAIHVAKYINNPHYLARVDAKAGKTVYNAVVTQYEKLGDMDYSFQVFCTAPCSLRCIPLTRKYHTKLVSAWREGLSGGSASRPTHAENPQFLITLTHTSDVLLKLEAPKVFFVNIMVFATTSPQFLPSTRDHLSLLSSGDYRDGYCTCEGKKLPPGYYVVVVSTFEVNQVGPFFLTAESDTAPFEFKQVLK